MQCSGIRPFLATCAHPSPLSLNMTYSLKGQSRMFTLRIVGVFLKRVTAINIVGSMVLIKFYCSLNLAYFTSCGQPFFTLGIINFLWDPSGGLRRGPGGIKHSQPLKANLGGRVKYLLF